LSLCSDMADHPSRSMPPLAQALRTYRNGLGLTREAAAEKHGVPLVVWRDWEQAGKSPRTHLAEVAGAIICDLLDKCGPDAS